MFHSINKTHWMLLVLGIILAGCSAEQSAAAPETTTTTKAKAKKTVKHTNRLSRETSPYLLLHAHNPVDWYPWGAEAFEKAKKEKKPIFLSVGYSSCYWCHVMERLVFENEEIAAYMNKHYVNIKVDREERPDVDDIYMTALQVYHQAIGSRQGGGWPLSMFITPEGKPIAGGTYFPPKAKGGHPGFLTVLNNVNKQWTDNKAQVEKNAEVLTAHVQRVMKPRVLMEKIELNRDLVNEVISSVIATHDTKYGGIDFHSQSPNSPKFPTPSKLILLQYDIGQSDESKSAKPLYHTLDHIANGGIQDHLEGGFHRYSTDRQWHVPHFEKMLYDQAQLADVYVEAFRQTNNEYYREVAEGIFSFVLTKMTNKQGGFYSALDAETDGVEGSYYVWSKEEVAKILKPEDVAIFSTVYGLNEPQTFEHGYVLHITQPLADVAKANNITVDVLKKRLAASRKLLLAQREKRPKLLLDDKVLTSWNGLMVRALANGGVVLKNKKYIAAAQKAARFLLTELRDDKGNLQRTWREDKSKLNAYVDDYAFLIDGLLALHSATGEEEWLTAATKLADDQIKLFWDKETTGFFFTSHHHEELIARTKNAYDAVLPSGNSVSARNYLKLAALTDNKKYQQTAKDILNLFAGNLKTMPRGSSNMALAMGEFLDAPQTKPTTKTTTGKKETLLAEDTEPKVTPVLKTKPGESSIILVAAYKPPTDKKKEKNEKVSVKIYLSTKRLPAGRKIKIALLIKIEKGWHINSNLKKPEFVIPTSVTLKTKHGSKLINMKYPKGKRLLAEGFDEALIVYENEVKLFGEIEIPAKAAGQLEELEIKVRYQACNEKNCLAPKTVKMEAKIPITQVGEEVKKVNVILFEKPKMKDSKEVKQNK